MKLTTKSPKLPAVSPLAPPSASPTIKLLVEDPIVVNPGQTVSLVCITTGGEPSPLLNWASSNDSLPPRSLVFQGTPLTSRLGALGPTAWL